MTQVQIAFLSRDGRLGEEFTVNAPKGRGRVTRVLIVPGEEVLGRRISVPGATPAQVRAAALAQLAPDLAALPDTLAVGLGDRLHDKRLVCVADRGRVEGWRNQAIAAGFPPDLIVPDFALLDAGAGEEAATARKDGMILASGQDIAFAAEPDLARTLLGGRRTHERDLETDALTWVRARFPGEAADLLSGLPGLNDAAEARQRMSRTGLAAAVALLLGVAAPWIHAYRINAAARDMRATAASLAQEVVPDAAPGAPRAALAGALSAYRAGEGSIGLVTDILAGLALAEGADVKRIELIGPGEARAQLVVASPESLVPVREHLAQRRLAVEEMSAPVEAGRLSIEFLVRSAP